MPDFDFDGDAAAPHHANGNGRGGPFHGGLHKIAALPVAKFFSSVNWRNRAAGAPAAPAAPKPLLGAMTVSRFLAAVNWRNAAAPSPLETEEAPVALPPTTDMVLQDFVWE